LGRDMLLQETWVTLWLGTKEMPMPFCPMMDGLWAG
jgi:hypothetical protein